MIDLRPKSAFSLVELSIVLVILGLLVGGVLSGQSLIRAAELRSVAADYARFYTAAQTFRDKYFAIPGDMTNATAFWGDDNANCADAAVPNGTPGTCNGNGDGLLAFAGAASSTGEIYQFWKQLALAGSIEGTYSGIAGSAAGTQALIGTNVPRGRISNSAFTIVTYTAPGDASNYAMVYGNQMTFGASNGNVDTSGRIIKAEEAWNIDTKLDDGRPGTGSIISIYWDECTTSANFSDLTGQYALSESGVNCALRYRNFI